MPFVKLDCGILNSTLWLERECRELFITALLMAEPFETRTPLPQIAITSLEYTGWSVPPGWYGFVPAASVGIIHRARVEQEIGLVALGRLGEPEEGSRSREFEGRRLVRVDGGFIVLNFMKYRERDYTAAERSKRYRQRLAAQKKTKPSRRDNGASRVIITQAEAEAEAEVQKQDTHPRTSSESDSPELQLFEHYRTEWHKRYGIPAGIDLAPLTFAKLQKQLTAFDVPFLERAITAFCQSDDPFALKAKHPFPLFLNNPSSWLAKPQAPKVEATSDRDVKQDTFRRDEAENAKHLADLKAHLAKKAVQA